MSPPAWVQTADDERAVRPGDQLDAPGVIVIGRGGSAGLQVGGENLMLAADTIWNLPSHGAGTGNLMQGTVNTTRRLLGEHGSPPASALSCAGRWRLRLGPSLDRESAVRAAAYLDRAGYPARALERPGESGTAGNWWVGLSGYAEASDALAAGRSLVASVPGLTQVAVEQTAQACAH